MSVEKGSYFETGDQGKENLDLESTLREVYALIAEMDMGRYDTLVLKRYINKNLFDKKNNIRPEKLAYLTKMVNREYYENYLNFKKISKYAREEYYGKQESEFKADKPFYHIPFEGSIQNEEGDEIPNLMILERTNNFEWVTFEVGTGYTAMANFFPKWLEFQREEWQETNCETIDANNYKIEYVAKAQMKDDTEFMLFRTFRSHAAGKCERYRLRFNSKEQADSFGHYLWALEQSEIKSQEIK